MSTVDIVKFLAERWFPVKEMSMWRDFAKDQPYMALAMTQRAELALGFRSLEGK